MKLSCDVIQDLLPLYHDGVCSEESKKIVEEHIATCTACKDVLHGLKEETAPDQVDAAGPLNAIGRAWKKRTRKALVKGVSIALILCMLFAYGWNWLSDYSCIPLTGEDVVILKLAQFDDGCIQIRTAISYQGKGVTHQLKFVPSERAIYEVVTRSPLSERCGLPNENEIETYSGNWSQFIFDPAGEKMWRDENDNMIPIEAYYFGEPGAEGTVLLWENGMELPPADDESAHHWEKTGDRFGKS